MAHIASGHRAGFSAIGFLTLATLAIGALPSAANGILVLAAVEHQWRQSASRRQWYFLGFALRSGDVGDCISRVRYVDDIVLFSQCFCGSRQAIFINTSYRNKGITLTLGSSTRPVEGLPVTLNTPP
ncbi:hypothetical protein N9L68_05965 [bacterium]|nr:hypothetical protein [bacterium]